MVKLTYREAVRQAIREAMQKDGRVFLMGEDVGRYGGSYAVSMGLLEEFGTERIRGHPPVRISLCWCGGIGPDIPSCL